MALVPREATGPLTTRRQVARVSLATLGATAAFILVLTLAAWFTRDTTAGVPQDDALAVLPAPLDAGVGGAGPAAGSADANPRPDAGAPVALADAGAVTTVAGDVDGGPADVARAPVDAAAVGALVLPAAQGCLEEAARFDPSLGGVGVLSVALGGDAEASARLTGLASPFFARCVVARTEALALPSPSERLLVRVTLRLDGLRTRASVERVDLEVEPAAP